jgi:acyl-CoA thioester hydrolase
VLGLLHALIAPLYNDLSADSGNSLSLIKISSISCQTLENLLEGRKVEEGPNALKMRHLSLKEVSMYTSEITILESHLDTFGHVNNATYLTLYEQARWDWISEYGLGLEQVHKDQVGPVILDLHLEFKKELRLRQKIKVESRFVEYKNRLVMQLEQQMLLPDDKTPASKLTLNVGLMDMKTRKLVPADERWLKALGADV